MTRILLCGCNGKMGRVIAACVKEREDCKIVAGIDIHTDPFGDFPVYASPSEVQEEADVVIDFSHPALLSPLLQFGLEHKLPLVLCTTGYNHDQVNALKQASHKIPVFYSGNMSLGINLLIGLSKKAAQVLGEDFDIEIIEKHHNQKIDAPSGTALMIADAISSVEDRQMTYMYDRHSQRKKRDKNEIGLHSVRGAFLSEGSKMEQMTIPTYETCWNSVGVDGRKMIGVDFEANAQILKEFFYGVSDSNSGQ